MFIWTKNIPMQEKHIFFSEEHIETSNVYIFFLITYISWSLYPEINKIVLNKMFVDKFHILISKENEKQLFKKFC